ncbi:MAG: hypothetical protein K6F29_03840 [Bacteroidales bacterium]|nr:hypothetical protein [Bacteroidales bacterium]
MKKLAILCLALFIVNGTQAQIFDKLKNAVSKGSSTTSTNSTTATSTANKLFNSGNSNLSTKPVDNNVKPSMGGKTYYVSAETGSNRNEGTDKTAPLKDLQKAIDLASNGSVICVAQGNYLGKLNCGYIEITDKYLSVVGGYNDNFSERNPIKYITCIQPTHEQDGTNGSRGYFTINVKGNRSGLILIDGLCLDMGLQNNYKAANTSDPSFGCPQGCETGLILETSQGNIAHQLMKGNVEGHLVVRNCVFVNGDYFGIQMNHIGGAWEIYNNVFVSNLFAACCIDGWNKEANQSYVDFHHNTVLFSWCRTKLMEDMGYGYCFRSNVDSDVHHNIFGCSNYAAMERTHANSNKEIEAKRKTSAYDNRFFMNRCDLLLPAPGGGTWTYVKASQFEDVEQLVKYENNAELSQSSNFMKAIDEAYLKGFAQIKKMESSSFDRNSAANQYRQAHGLNMQGTEIVRVSMYGNRYNMEKTFQLFGAEKGYGAQIPALN